MKCCLFQNLHTWTVESRSCWLELSVTNRPGQWKDYHTNLRVSSEHQSLEKDVFHSAGVVCKRATPTQRAGEISLSATTWQHARKSTILFKVSTAVLPSSTCYQPVSPTRGFKSLLACLNSVVALLFPFGWPAKAPFSFKQVLSIC